VATTGALHRVEHGQVDVIEHVHVTTAQAQSGPGTP
jgi:hypothetical protein